MQRANLASITSTGFPSQAIQAKKSSRRRRHKVSKQPINPAEQSHRPLHVSSSQDSSEHLPLGNTQNNLDQVGAAIDGKDAAQISHEGASFDCVRGASDTEEQDSVIKRLNALSFSIEGVDLTEQQLNLNRQDQADEVPPLFKICIQIAFVL